MICPCCQHPLHVGFELAENAFIAWCGYGPCSSMKANDGAFGRSEEQAMLNLVSKLNKNPDWSTDRPEEPDAAMLDDADHKNQMEKEDR